MVNQELSTINFPLSIDHSPLSINFGAKSLEFKRIINKKFNQLGQRPIN